MPYPDFYNDTDLSFEHFKKALSEACENRKSPFRTMNIGYINQNTPYIRTVVLRHCGPDLEFLQFHTDTRSPKVNALRVNSNISLHFYDSDSKMQFSINGIAKIHTQDDIAQQAWQKTQILSRRCYLSQIPPSSLIQQADAGFDEKFQDNSQTPEETEIGYENFTVIRIHITKIDWLYLHARGNRRIIFNKQDNRFVGHWCAP